MISQKDMSAFLDKRKAEFTDPYLFLFVKGL